MVKGDMLPVALEDAMAALEPQTGGTEGTAIASTGTGAGGAVGWGGRAISRVSVRLEVQIE